MALLVVMVLMGIMLTAGFAIASTVDTQTSASKQQRVRDSSFNLSESALNAQVFALARDWPGVGRSAAQDQFPACTQASVSTRCPDNASLVTGASPDLAGAAWTTSVRDNGSASSLNFYSDALSAGQPGYDANNDGRVWVRAQAVVQGRTRTLVALVRSDTQEEDIPRAALISGSLEITNNGNKELLKSNGGLVGVRCRSTDPGYGTAKACDGQPLGSKHDRVAVQITGTTPVTGYATPPVMTAEARARLRATAVANGTYYASCPTEAQMTGAVVWVESGNCSYTGNSQFNTVQEPGVLILNTGTLSLGGTVNYYGIIYSPNAAGIMGTVVQTQGNSQVTGGVLIDGDGQMLLGSSGVNLQYDKNAFRKVASIGSAGVVQNTFRELKAG